MSKPKKETTKKKRTTTKNDVEAKNNIVKQKEESKQEETKPEEPVVDTEVPTEEPQQEEATQEDVSSDVEAKKNAHEDILFKVDVRDTGDLLNYLQISTFPAINVEGIWTRAIAKVQKRDMSVSWVVIKRTAHATTSIEKVFGRCSPIAKIGQQFPIAAIPYSALEDWYKKGRDYCLQVIANSLNKTYNDVKDYTDEQINNTLIDSLIKEYWKYEYR